MRPFRMTPTRWFLVAATVLVLVAPGCKPPPPDASGTGTSTEMTPPPPAPTPEDLVGGKNDVKVVEISPAGTANPDPVKIKKKQQIVVWALDGEGELKIEFKGENPFDQQPTCDRGRFCIALKPVSEEKPYKAYKYDVSVTIDGKTTTNDPNVEVIP